MAAKEKEEKKIEYVNKKGLRLDGRKVDDLRPIKITAGVLPRASGSCYLEWGQNKIMVGVQGPKEALPKHLANPYKAIIDFHYRMATFSVPDRKIGKPGRREIEISKVLGEALEEAIFVEEYPNTVIKIFAEVFDSNAGTRVAALTAASVALADAGIAMRDLVSGISVGRAGGNLIVDLTKEEEDAEDAVDLPLGIMTNSGKITLMQMDGIIEKKELNKIMELGFEAAKKVKELQKKALLEKLKGIEVEKVIPVEENGNSKKEAE